MNSKLTAKERGLIKGALRRIFSRSDQRKQAIERTIVPTLSVPVEVRVERPRVKTWTQCPECKGFFAKSDMEVDHLDPIVPVTSTLEEMTADDLIDRIWATPDQLMAKCEPCHKAKTKIENAARRAAAKPKSPLTTRRVKGKLKT